MPANPTTAPALTEHDVTAALRKLGETTEDVYRNLAAGGHSGVPSFADLCPVAHYLRSVLSDQYQYSVFVSTVVSDGRSTQHHVIVPTPGPVFGFVRRFDDGEFADLVRPRGT